MDKPLSPDLVRKMDAYWRAEDYLSVGQVYLYENPLLKKLIVERDIDLSILRKPE